MMVLNLRPRTLKRIHHHPILLDGDEYYYLGNCCRSFPFFRIYAIVVRLFIYC